MRKEPDQTDTSPVASERPGGRRVGFFWILIFSPAILLYLIVASLLGLCRLVERVWPVWLITDLPKEDRVNAAEPGDAAQPGAGVSRTGAAST